VQRIRAGVRRGDLLLIRMKGSFLAIQLSVAIGGSEITDDYRTSEITY